jgi:hypothetical protein
MEDKNEGVDSEYSGAGDMSGSGLLGREGKHTVARGNMATLEGSVAVQQHNAR